jgi:hypothetical protein
MASFISDKRSGACDVNVTTIDDTPHKSLIFPTFNPGFGILMNKKDDIQADLIPGLFSASLTDTVLPYVHVRPVLQGPIGMRELLHENDQFVIKTTIGLHQVSDKCTPIPVAKVKPRASPSTDPLFTHETLFNPFMASPSAQEPWPTSSLTSKKQTTRHGLDDLCTAAAIVEGNEPARFFFDTETRYRQNSGEYYQAYATPRQRSSSYSTSRHRTPSARSDGFDTDTSTASLNSRRSHRYTPTAPRPGIGFGRVNVSHQRTNSDASVSSTLISEDDIPETTRYASVTTSVVSFHEAISQLIKPDVLDHLFPERNVVKADAEYLTNVPPPVKPAKITWSKTPPSRLDSNAQGYNLLTSFEVEVCELLRLVPNSYLAVREAMLRGQALNQGERVKKIECKRWFSMDVNKVGKLYDWFCELGWM